MSGPSRPSALTSWSTPPCTGGTPRCWPAERQRLRGPRTREARHRNRDASVGQHESSRQRSCSVPEKFSDVDAYIASFPAEVQSVLADIRRTIHEAVPGSAEVISYNIP